MQPLFRHFLLLLIAFCLPLASWADAAGPVRQPCSAMASLQAGMAKMDCCADAATMDKAGSPCKAGQECKTGSFGQAGVRALFIPVQNTSPMIGTQADHLPTAAPAGLWRPPRQA
ncbi:hypothetical protein FNU76_03460 [Chitinimonas arctica]|uniref:CopL family metal-binding regulatory protein n=1 Tax=Chitinimonas arctica TaxID=2594795 RepID=A0A516SBF6_9NEIS|nr:hypothetical protein [Chitinimonas arctica]QDQ25487.1 hypothetical protein FNU76_03460 [Chitinimonas arctica]